MKLSDRTRELLLAANLDREGRRNLAQTLGVTTGWLRDFELGYYQDPGVNKVQQLYEILAGRPLL